MKIYFFQNNEAFVTFVFKFDSLFDLMLQVALFSLLLFRLLHISSGAFTKRVWIGITTLCKKHISQKQEKKQSLITQALFSSSCNTFTLPFITEPKQLFGNLLERNLNTSHTLHIFDQLMVITRLTMLIILY